MDIYTYIVGAADFRAEYRYFLRGEGGATVLDPYRWKSECPGCGCPTTTPPPGDLVFNKNLEGNIWADVWSSEIVVSERVLTELRRVAGHDIVRSIPVHFAPGIVIDRRIRDLPPPRYFLIEPTVRYPLDLKAMNATPKLPACPVCGRNKGGFVEERRLGERFLLPDKPAPVFCHYTGFPTIYCTHDFAVLAARNGWTNFELRYSGSWGEPYPYPGAELAYWALPEAKGAPKPQRGKASKLPKPKSEEWGAKQLESWQALAVKFLESAGKAWGEELEFDHKTVFVLDRLAARDRESLPKRLRDYLANKKAIMAILCEILSQVECNWPDPSYIAEYGSDVPWVQFDGEKRFDELEDEVDKWLAGGGEPLAEIFCGGATMESYYLTDADKR